MARNDWYRRTTWSRDDQAAFHARLERSRSSFHKAQYARIQAVYLERTGDRKLIVAALELLDLVLAKWPEPFELSCVYWQKATCHERLGDLDSAAEDFRKAIEAEEMPGGAQTGARKDFLWFIATNKLEDLYPEALRLLESAQGELRLPIDSFRVHGAAALILEAQGKLAEAARHAESALEAASLEESGYRYHRQLGLVGAKHEDVVQHLRNLTET